MVRPLHDRILAQRLDEQDRMSGGLFIPDKDHIIVRCVPAAERLIDPDAHEDSARVNHTRPSAPGDRLRVG